MNTYPLAIKLHNADGSPLSGVTVVAELTHADVSTTSVVFPLEVSTTTNANGEASLSLMSNLDGLSNSLYRITAYDSTDEVLLNGLVRMPRSAATLSELMTENVQPPLPVHEPCPDEDWEPVANPDPVFPPITDEDAEP